MTESENIFSVWRRRRELRSPPPQRSMAKPTTASVARTPRRAGRSGWRRARSTSRSNQIRRWPSPPPLPAFLCRAASRDTALSAMAVLSSPSSPSPGTTWKTTPLAPRPRTETALRSARLSCRGSGGGESASAVMATGPPRDGAGIRVRGRDEWGRGRVGIGCGAVRFWYFPDSIRGLLLGCVRESVLCGGQGCYSLVTKHSPRPHAPPAKRSQCFETGSFLINCAW
jgi:hypothetical protein